MNNNTPQTAPPFIRPGGPQARLGLGTTQPDLSKYLPTITDQERHNVRAQILETIQKDMSSASVHKLVEANNMGGGGTTADRGEYSSMSAIDISVQLETLIFSKYSDSASANYKQLSKKVVASLKSNQDQRQSLLEIKEQAQIEDYLLMFIPRAKQMLQQQENAGSVASGSSSNPFAFNQAKTGPPMASQQKKVQQRNFPQSRFPTADIFQIPAQQPPAVSMGDEGQLPPKGHQNSNLGQSILEVPQFEQDRPQNNNFEERKFHDQTNAESGSSESQGLVRPPVKGALGKGDSSVNDALSFFSQMADSAIKSEPFSQNSQPVNQKSQIDTRVITSSEQPKSANLSHSLYEEQSREEHNQNFQGLHRSTFDGEQHTTIQDVNTRHHIHYNNQIESGKDFFDFSKEEGPVQPNFEELNEGMEKQPLQISPQSQKSNQQNSSYKENTHLRREPGDDRIEEERSGEAMGRVIEQEKDTFPIIDEGQLVNPQNSSELGREINEEIETSYNIEQFNGKNLSNSDLPPRGRNQTQSYNTEVKTVREDHFSQLTNQSQASRNMSSPPAIQGFIQSYQTSRPPQSVASINMTNLEDSETMIRAYKKKKQELEEMRERFYQMETDYFTEKQRSVLFEEEVQQLRLSVTKSERQLKDIQIKSHKNDSEVLSKQLALKQKETEAYQKEVVNQKTENAKLRERIKELMARGRQGTPIPVSECAIFAQQQDNGAEAQARIRKLETDINQMQLKLDQSESYVRKVQTIENEFPERFAREALLIRQNYNLEVQDLTNQRESLIKQLDSIKGRLVESEDMCNSKTVLIEQLGKQIADLKLEVVKKDKSASDLKMEESFVKIDAADRSSPVGGFYEANNSSSKSGDQKKQIQSPVIDYPTLNSQYFGGGGGPQFQSQSDPNDKQSSAPASAQLKQSIQQQPQSQVSQQVNRPHQQTQSRAAPNQQNQNAFSIFDSANDISQAEDFYSSLGNQSQVKSTSQKTPQQQQQISQPQQQRQTQQMQGQQQNKSNKQQTPAQQQIPKIQQQQPQQIYEQRPPKQNIANTYDMSLDDFSIDQSFSGPQTNSYQQPQQIQQNPPQQQVQRSQPPPVQQQIKQKPQQQQRTGQTVQQHKPATQYFLDDDEDDVFKRSSNSKQESTNVIPKSMFD